MEAVYNFCPRCAIKHSPDVIYCPICGIPTVPRNPGAEKTNPNKEIRRALVKLEVDRKFPFLRFWAGAITLVGILMMVAAWPVAFNFMGVSKVASSPVSDAMGYLPLPSQTISVTGMFFAIAIWLIMTIQGGGIVAFGQLINLLISQHDEIQMLNGVVQKLALIMTREE
jgi:hypothetical protein